MPSLDQRLWLKSYNYENIKASTHPQEENVIDPDKGELHLVEHEIGNNLDKALQTKVCV